MPDAPVLPGVACRQRCQNAHASGIPAICARTVLMTSSRTRFRSSSSSRATDHRLKLGKRGCVLAPGQLLDDPPLKAGAPLQMGDTLVELDAVQFADEAA